MFRFSARLVLVTVLWSFLVPAADAQAQPAGTGSMWNGVFLGVSGGLGRGTPKSSVEWNDNALAEGPHPPAVPANYSKRIDGPLGGGQLGWNHQWGRVVAGLEADMSVAKIEGDLSVNASLAPPSLVSYRYDERLELERVGTVRARLGLAPADRWLLFVTGGLAYGEAQATTNLRFFSSSGVQTVQYPGAATETRTGWTIGGGTEVALTGSWRFRVDYLHIDLGTMEVRGIRAPAFPTLFIVNEQSVKSGLLRVGLNYRFGDR